MVKILRVIEKSTIISFTYEEKLKSNCIWFVVYMLKVKSHGETVNEINVKSWSFQTYRIILLFLLSCNTLFLSFELANASSS